MGFSAAWPAYNALSISGSRPNLRVRKRVSNAYEIDATDQGSPVGSSLIWLSTGEAVTEMDHAYRILPTWFGGVRRRQPASHIPRTAASDGFSGLHVTALHWRVYY
jgi:hypothetical protein